MDENGKLSPNFRYHFACLALLLIGCANPVQKDIVKFGETAGVLADATNNIYLRHRSLVAQDNIEQAVFEYSNPQKTEVAREI